MGGAVIPDGATLRLFVNGRKSAAGPLRLGGNRISGEYLQGRLDEVRLYARVLSASELQTDLTTPVKTP